VCVYRKKEARLKSLADDELQVYSGGGQVDVNDDVRQSLSVAGNRHRPSAHGRRMSDGLTQLQLSRKVLTSFKTQ